MVSDATSFASFNYFAPGEFSLGGNMIYLYLMLFNQFIEKICGQCSDKKGEITPLIAPLVPPLITVLQTTAGYSHESRLLFL